MTMTTMTSMLINAGNITSLTGTSYTGITRIIWRYSTLDSTVLAKFPNLTFLDCAYCGLTTLDGLDCPQLHTLFCSYNNLTTIGTINCPNLVEFYSRQNSLTDLTGIPTANLVFLSVAKNMLTSVDLTAFVSLRMFDGSQNQITTVNFTNNTLLLFLCYNNQLTSLSGLNCPNLQVLNCASNNIQSFDISAYTALQEMYCDGSLLSYTNGLLNGNAVIRFTDTNTGEIISIGTTRTMATNGEFYALCNGIINYVKAHLPS